MTRGALTRRDWLGLGLLSTGALAAGQYLQRGQPLGRDISQSVDVPALLNAPGFPAEGAGPAVAITMLVFSDYACGVCRQAEPWWRAAVAEAGDVRVVHRDWPILGAPSLRAARIALAADAQGRYLPVHDALMRRSGLDEPALRAAVDEAGADWARLSRDLQANSEAIARQLVRTAQDALRLGFRGTPGFLIGPIRIEGGASERQFAQAIVRARDAIS